MPKENRSASRRSKPHSLEFDDDSPTSSGRESLKSVSGRNRYSPFIREVPRRDSRMEKESMTLMHPKLMQPKSSGIIESGIKYIMFPLHLLRFCIFGTSSGSIIAEQNLTIEHDKPKAEGSGKKEKVTTKEEDKKESKHREEPDAKEKSSSPAKSLKSQEPRKSSKVISDPENKLYRSSTSKKDSSKAGTSDKEDSVDEMVTAVEDSDSSTDQWSSANDIMIMNMSMDYENLNDRSMSYRILEEPMDISIDERTLEKSHSVTKMVQNPNGSQNSKNIGSPVREQVSHSTVDEEIARIFQKQCTSSDDEVSPTSSKTPAGSAKQNNSRHHEETIRPANVSRLKKELVRKSEKKKKTSGDYVISKRRKTDCEVEADEEERDRRSEGKGREEKGGSRQDTPSKHRSRSSRTPVKSKESRRRDVKYMERGTQTDSAFSDEDVEMLPIDTRHPEKRFCCRSAIEKWQATQVEEMDQDLDYVADNEDSNDGSRISACKRISSDSTSSSSTDLGFEERPYITSKKDFSSGRWQTISPDFINTHRVCVSRAPPGFPELPQNPPLTTYVCNGPQHFTLMGMTSEDNSQNSSILQAAVPPAPTPMRHLYYNYPEFMDLPQAINSSKILRNILETNYYR